MNRLIHSACFTALALLFVPGALNGQNVQLLSTVDPALVPAGGSGDSWTPVISPDGRYVLFCSTANNLMVASNNLPIPGGFPPRLNVFLRDRTAGTTILVSVNSSGVAGGNGSSMPVDISTNGQYVLFESTASDLVPGDTNNARDLFVRDIINRTTVLVSVGTNGFAGNGASGSPVMTPDGRYVAFISAANDLVPGDTNGVADVFVRDLQSNTTALASPGALYQSRDFAAEAPEISDDGRYVVFFSQATNLAAGVTGQGDIYVRDLVNNATLWASAWARTEPPSTNVVCFNHSLSADGRYVAYEAAEVGSAYGRILRYDLQTGQTLTVETNAAASRSLERVATLDISPDGRFIVYIANAYDTAGTNTCIRLWDAQTGASTLVSGDQAGSVPPTSLCDWPTVDATGHYVGFLSTAPGLVTNAVTGSYHLYLRDLQAGTTLLLDTDTNNVGAGVSAGTVPRLSADARLVALECNDGNMVSGDRNRAWDVFLRDLITGNVEMISAREATLPSATPNGPSTITPYSVSSDGRWLAFCSAADNLVPNDTNGWRDVFVRDVYNGVTALVSVATNGGSADNFSSDPAISSDGRYVAFTSSADNLTAGLGTGKQQVFLRDLQTGAMTLISVNTNGTAANGDCFSPMVSPDGRFVLYWSKAFDLADRLIPNRSCYFLRDVQLGKTFLLGISPSLSTIPVAAAVTPNWQFLAVAGTLSVYGSTPVIRVWDTQLSTWVPGTPTNQSDFFSALAITPDGKKIAFAIGSTIQVFDLRTGESLNLNSQASPCTGVQFSQNGRFLMWVGTRYYSRHVFSCDLQNPPLDPILVDYAVSSPGLGGTSNGDSDSASMSPDGHYIVYRSSAGNIVSADTNGVADIFIYDRLTNTNRLLSASVTGGFPDHVSARPVFTADGRTIIFISSASDLVGQDFNYDRDIFAYPFLYAVLLPSSLPEEGPWVSWPYIPNRNYRVQYQDALGPTGWLDLNGSISNFVSRAYLKDSSPNARQRFYRVLSY